jgi:beta-phosphoglucomutase-like phosphatase (HAD superfamily)
VAVVSNNSAQAHSYLDRHGLAALVQHAQGRDSDDPHRMKPNPYSVSQALAALHASAVDAVLIGDSVTDIDAARAVDVRVIAYANKPDKTERLAGADAATSDMHVLARAALSAAALARINGEQAQQAQSGAVSVCGIDIS